jgi:L,D-peptidoglycan transpeptidase YkuD (ErfK/YbiS/YcfS/YnhG family)
MKRTARSMGTWAWVAMAAMAAGACSSDRKADASGAAPALALMATPAAPAPSAPATSAPAAAAPASAPTPAAPPTPAAASNSPIPAEAHQLILGVVEDWDAIPVELSRWERTDDGGAWQPAGAPWTGVVGSGIAWGRGLHGEGPPAGHAGQAGPAGPDGPEKGPLKQEGDGRSPAGAFALNGAYGYARQPPATTRWAYTPVDGSWHCVDDSTSRVYGTIVDADEVAKDWTSSEKMKRRDALYTWVIDVAHNPAHTAKAGSCIFLHVWRAEGTPTVGCTAMPQPRLEQVLTWIDPAAHPVYVLLPRPAYAALARSWGLPAR